MIHTVQKIILPLLLVILFGSLVMAFAKGKSGSGNPQSFRVKQVNLVSSVEGVAAKTDDKLTDAWGLEFGHTGRVWLNNSSGFSTVYNGRGEIINTKDESGSNVPLAVKIPSTDETVEPAPLTGLVFSDEDSFSGDSFIFVTEQGTIAGWHKNTDGTEPLTATVRVDKSKDGAVYKGAASMKTKEDGWLLYAANFGEDKVDVFTTNYEPKELEGNFEDPTLPDDYAPFNIKEINGDLYIAFAKQSIDKANDVQGEGNGYISIFNEEGGFVRRFAEGGHLNSPWGLALTPSNFGAISNRLLIGNFGDGRIHVYDIKNGNYLGSMVDEKGNKLQIDGLWSLTFGTGNGAGEKNELFFAAGPSAEDQGIFGKILPLDN